MIVCAISSIARAGILDDQTIPGKWLRPLLPEQVEEPQYPDYDKDSALAKAQDQYWAGQYRRALVTVEGFASTLQSLKKGRARQIALLRGQCQLELGRYNDVLETCANPAFANDPTIQTLRARAMAEQGGYVPAIGILQAEIQKNPDVVAPRYYLGEYRERLGDVAGATAAYGWFVDGREITSRNGSGIPRPSMMPSK